MGDLIHRAALTEESKRVWRAAEEGADVGVTGLQDFVWDCKDCGIQPFEVEVLLLKSLKGEAKKKLRKRLQWMWVQVKKR